MTLAYRPGDSFAHRLDPRSKLAFQGAFAVAAFGAGPAGLAALSAVALLAARGADTDPLDALWEYRFVLPFLAFGPVVRALTWGAPWVDPPAALPAVVASYRVLLVLVVSAAYVRSTPVRDSRGAVQRLVPGRAGQFLGMGVAFVFRFLPVLQRDVGRIRDAMAARLGAERPLVDRIELVAVAGLNRAFARADTFALALRARCFSWNPTLPRLRFSRADVAVTLGACGLLAFTLM